MPEKTRASRRAGSPRPPRRPGAKPLRGNRFLALLDTVRVEVDTRMAGLLDSKLDDARAHGPEVLDMAQTLRELCLRGGKRLRAALLVAGYRAASATLPLEPALDAAVAIELLHTYFLIHDDWMDDDAVRRGGPSVHTLLARRYRSKKLGQSSAILVGDYAAALATEALARVDVPAARIPRMFAAFAQMQSDAIAGQQLDVIGRGENVEKTYELKTGSYTVAGPLRLGALIAGGSPDLIADLERFALPTGIAFQIRDDLLSVFGDPAETGKPFANDIRSGKRTVLMEHAFELCRGKDRAALKRAWRSPRATVGELRRAVEALDRSGARRAVEERIQSLIEDARGALALARLPEPRRELLLGAVAALTDRRS